MRLHTTRYCILGIMRTVMLRSQSVWELSLFGYLVQSNS
ncbi:hypothetical protein KL86PLE_40255 [uncultured Pleomorphomonas sp.]|uniref:Uncharacterized protein n=1 Tax=uncultured Pleomorphomonas sp. TaxID=442121 RepID=A0A212LG49_9HYPH|nr:hypothetical protein KL86PLE_40255 [uncultured Pleomorphomonas sp.]